MINLVHLLKSAFPEILNSDRKDVHEREMMLDDAILNFLERKTYMPFQHSLQTDGYLSDLRAIGLLPQGILIELHSRYVPDQYLAHTLTLSSFNGEIKDLRMEIERELIAFLKKEGLKEAHPPGL